MEPTQIVASIVFALGYLGIILEHQAHINKAAFALVMGGLLWVIVGVSQPDQISAVLSHSTAEIFSIVVFLLASMVLVEVLVHYRVFDYVQAKLEAKHISPRRQFWIVTALAFVLSGVLNNLTVTIVMIQIARKFFWGKNLLLVAAGIVIASNAGGAFSPIGDVTTIMMWFAGKFTALEVLLGGLLPSLTLYFVAMGLLERKFEDPDAGRVLECHDCPRISKTDGAVVAVVSFAFLLPVIARIFNVPPVIGILLGVGLTWLVVDSFRHFTHERTHLNASIEKMIQKTDISSIKFFIGILLAVSALGSLGILEHLSGLIYGSQSFTSIVLGNTLLGAVSGIFDNIPLTAVALEVLHSAPTPLWVLLAITVGTGGSLLLVGSASGVIAAGMVRKLTFGKYMQYAFVPALLGFVAAVGVWLLQYYLFL